MDIEFGKLQQSLPSTGLRPDRDGQLVVAAIGNPQANELPIFVDLDVMRDMEAHAVSNTRVELGGVMLGYQRLDFEGRPFVVITDCLRAEHYEATKGSFKFTHETWSQITRDRAKFKPELEMVGWYHTHPGWSVFLSGMDLFICDNFFNRPLDVALVIDPCTDDRGWFYWANPTATSSSAAVELEVAEIEPDPDIVGAPVRTGGFYLMTGRFREDELDYFVNLYQREPTMNRDPRYSNPTGNQLLAAGQPMVQPSNQRNPVFEIILASMILTQFLLLALIAWRIMVPSYSPLADSTDVVVLKERLAQLEGNERNRIEREAQQEVLQMIVSAQTGPPDFVEKYSQLKTTLEQTNSNLTAQMSLSEQLKQSQLISANELAEKSEINDRLSTQLQVVHQELKVARTQAEALANNIDDAEANPPSGWAARLKRLDLPWWAAIVSGLGVLGLGAGGGYLYGKSGRQVKQLENGESEVPGR
jgi:proteasome lid subunit RPN8/RPN11